MTKKKLPKVNFLNVFHSNYKVEKEFVDIDKKIKAYKVKPEYFSDFINMDFFYDDEMGVFWHEEE